MDGVNLAALTENAARLGTRIQETIHEHTRDLSIMRGGASLFDLPDDKNIGRQLESNADRDKLEALKRLIALTSKGRNMSSHFPQVVKNVASQNLEIRKLVYIYLLRYAEQEPDVALLSINTFQRDLTDSNPLIRAMALRVLSGIKVPMIVTVVTLAIKQCAADISPYVRKAAALAIPKMHRLDPSQQPTLITIISTLLRDRSPLSIGSAVIAFESVCPTRLDLLHQQYRRLCRVVVEVDEWGQVDLLNLLLRYARTMLQRPILTCEGESHKEDLDGDLQLLLSSAEPLFHSRNPAVVLAVVRVFYYGGSPSSLNKIVNPLLRILHSSRATERVVLSYLLVVAREHPHLFWSRHTRLLVCASDSPLVKREKIKILLALCNLDNHQALLREFIDYADDPDSTVVADAVSAIGQCARRVPACAQQCISALLTMIKSRNEFVVGRAILILKLLVQNQLQDVPLSVASSSHSPLNIISQLAHKMDDISHPQARACVLWLVGQYCPVEGENTVIDGVADWAPDVLRKAAKSFSSDDCTVRLQTLTLAAKLFVLCPTNSTLGLVCQYVFSLGRYDINYDVRDRTRTLTSLLGGISPSLISSSSHVDDQDQDQDQVGDRVVLRREQVKKVLFEGKAGIVDDELYTGRNYLIGSLSLLTGKDMRGDADTPLPDWLEMGIDPALRDNAEEIALMSNTQQSLAPLTSSSSRPVGISSVTSDKFTPAASTLAPNRLEADSLMDLDKFYASDSEESVEDGTSEEEEEEECEDSDNNDEEDEDEDEEGEGEGEEGEKDTDKVDREDH